MLPWCWPLLRHNDGEKPLDQLVAYLAILRLKGNLASGPTLAVDKALNKLARATHHGFEQFMRSDPLDLLVVQVIPPWLGLL
jgi:hypothetical protein